jgi:uncharacterized membrane protein
MNKQKSIFVTALLSVLLLSLNAALYIVARPAFFVFLGFFSLIGFLGFAAAFCKWLEKPSKEKEEAVEPPEVVQGEEVYDFNSIIDEVKRDAETKEK